MKYSYDINKIRKGNPEEFRRLIDINMDRVYAIALRITADTEDAGDIVQDTFIKVWKKRGSVNNGKSIEGLIRRIVINKCYDLLRKRKRIAVNQADNEIFMNLYSDDEADKELNNKETASIISSLCNGLSPRQKLVFTLVDLEQMSHDEVAGITGLSKSSIKSNLNYARKKIRDGMRKHLKE